MAASNSKDNIFGSCSRFLPATYLQQADDVRRSLDKDMRHLLDHKRLPDHGWSDQQIEFFLQRLSLMDSNNFPSNCGVGEREARVASTLVKRRHFYLAHGIGRSGDLAAVQPKAAGSSIINHLTNSLLLDILRMCGSPSTTACILVPTATGMALTLTLLTLHKRRPQAKYVIWPRIDQKSCFKSIDTAGLEAVVIENVLEGDELRTDLSSVEKEIERVGGEQVVCVMSTTSCFAPRAVDRVEELSEICSRYDIPHLVNNAYGVQSSKCMHVIEQGSKRGRVDVYVQSTDKNLMVPVGGAVVAGFDAKLIEEIGKSYPGRASISPSLDVLITLLSLGREGYKTLLDERKHYYKMLKERLGEVGKERGYRLLNTPHNPISLALSVEQVMSEDENAVTALGSKLFLRGVSGSRVVSGEGSKTIAGHTFQGYQAHYNHYPTPYITAAAAIGIDNTDIEQFIKRLDKLLAKHIKPKDGDEVIKQ